ncbi:hypothetical protein THAOC_28026 [Thalassiosira oceanica]|uniref:Uncharacterized protein n=1 Tax=Thalassiosira oceanica TaxID=159749 RepID=K0RV48_THAOC|nr:hypothetical protein THAOC_28026 [Thalassiosira oceanica]|eukprot:EJK52676.1 hypothetical protein THAOC_28026 [Thalassiosira oceanica]
MTTIKRWITRLQTQGNVLQKRPTGNKYSEREIHGSDLINLALFRLIRPKSIIDECRAYLYNRNPANAPYSHSQIHRAEERLGLCRKVASTTSELAHLPINRMKRKNYWERPYPLGIRGMPTRKMIDIDEAAFLLEDQNRNRGKVTREKRCDAAGKYKKGAGRLSLLLGVSGDDQNPFAFHRTHVGGVNTYRFYLYMRDFIGWLDVNRPNEFFCFTMDNLNIHKHPLIIDLIEDAGHRVVYRAPYWSCDGAIEYVFNTIHYFLQMGDGVDGVDELEDRLDDIIFDLTQASFRRYFEHVGFPVLPHP